VIRLLESDDVNPDGCGILGIMDGESSLRRVDLNPSPALIIRKLLILQYAKLGTIGENGESYTFLTLLLSTRPWHAIHIPPLVAYYHDCPVPPKTLRAYQNCFLPRNGKR
jgi:hypothetical protein